MTAAGVLPPEKRSVFLERIAARLNLRDPRLPISDTDLSKAIRSALTGPQRGRFRCGRNRSRNGQTAKSRDHLAQKLSTLGGEISGLI